MTIRSCYEYRLQTTNRILNLPRIIFWNVNKKDLTSLVCSITKLNDADVVVLNENQVPIADMLQALRTNVSQDFYCPNSTPSSEKRFHCFCRNSELDLSELHALQRSSVRKINIGQHKVLLALVHGVDMRNYDTEARQSSLQTLMTDMEFVKEQQKTNKLILLGDFNMNPYDRGMNLAAGLNAMMTKSCVEKGLRKYMDRDYDFYYNPMWSLFGDNTDGPAGTVYDISNQGPYGWSMLDQVLINHSIVSLFQDVRILTEAGTQSLMDGKGRPNSSTASDHFPILVTFCGD
jgi:endonuclease/exonuclease/phosphatase (EEP) superfamily protein YafD